MKKWFWKKILEKGLRKKDCEGYWKTDYECGIEKESPWRFGKSFQTIFLHFCRVKKNGLRTNGRTDGWSVKKVVKTSNTSSKSNLIQKWRIKLLFGSMFIISQLCPCFEILLSTKTMFSPLCGWKLIDEVDQFGAPRWNLQNEKFNLERYKFK